MIKRTLALSLLFLLPTHAKDVGQWGSNVGPEMRAWFDGVYNRKGLKCCEAADGYPVEYQMRSDNHYWVRFKDEWYEVPDEAVVRQYGNWWRGLVRRSIWWAGRPLLRASCGVLITGV